MPAQLFQKQICACQRFIPIENEAASYNSLLRYNKNAMMYANEQNHPELMKFFAEYQDQTHQDSRTVLNEK